MRIGVVKKLSFFEPDNFCFVLFSSSLAMKSVTNYGVAWIGPNLYDYHALQPKAMGAIEL